MSDRMFLKPENSYYFEQKHDDHCQYTQTIEQILSKFIDAGCFISLRRKICKFTLANMEHPSSKIYLRSSTALQNEQHKNLLHYYSIIHPFSLFNQWRCMAMFVVFSIMLVSSPFQLILFNRIYRIFDCMLEFLYVANMIVTFSIGFYNPNTSKIVLNRKAIVRRYLKTFFVPDFVSVIGALVLRNISEDKTIGWLYLTRFMIDFRLVRVVTYLTDWIGDMKAYFGWSEFVLKCVRLLCTIIIIIGINCNYTMLLMLVHYPEVDYVGRLRDVVFGAIVLSFTRYHPIEKHHYSHTSWVLIFQAILFLSIIFQLYMITQIYQLWSIKNETNGRKGKIMEQFNTFMKYQKVPHSLRLRVSNFLDFKYQGNFYRDDYIHKILSKRLCHEIMINSVHNLLCKVEYFNLLPDAALYRLIDLVTMDVFLPNEVIVTAGHRGNAMFLISTGTVAVYSASGVEICHLRDGDHFGEIALLYSRTKRVATVIAVSHCELYKLDKNDFMDLMEMYPNVHDQIRHLAERRKTETESRLTADHIEE